MNIPQMIDELTRNRFWGIVELKFNDGQIVLITKSETLLNTRRTRNNERTN